MKTFEVNLDKRAADSLKAKASDTQKNYPSWWFEKSAPLQLEVFTDDQIKIGEKEVLSLCIGNSGLNVFFYSDRPYLVISFGPNANYDNNRSDEQDNMANVGIWAAAFKGFVEWWASPEAGRFFEKKSIEGRTNISMFTVRKRLLRTLSPDSFKEKKGDLPLHASLREFTIDLEKAHTGLTSPSYEKTFFAKVVARTLRDQNSIRMLNPRFDKRMRGEKVYYTL